MEVARLLGHLRKGSWKPRRTIVFCNFAAEEYMAMGSQEWVSHKINKLKTRAVGVVSEPIINILAEFVVYLNQIPINLL